MLSSGDAAWNLTKETILKETLMTSAHVIDRDQPRGSRLGAPLKRRLARAWQAYWEWQRRRTTVRILAALDERTLKDIGINPSEITSYAYGDPEQRRRRCEVSWRWSSHA
jgi:uncharacterized protein YjiS (DUF1127 family)